MSVVIGKRLLELIPTAGEICRWPRRSVGPCPGQVHDRPFGSAVDKHNVVIAAFAPRNNLDFATKELMTGREFRYQLCRNQSTRLS
jgi:hypothetical protein